jgi:hypothetical protein
MRTKHSRAALISILTPSLKIIISIGRQSLIDIPPTMRVTDPNEIAMLDMANLKSETACIETGSKPSLEKDEQTGEGEEGMTRAKWLALIALGIGYTTAFQQGACIGVSNS